MAGDWIKMRIDLQTHPKVFRIVSALKADRLRVIGGLHVAWSIFDTHSADGVLLGYDCNAMDAVIGWPGFTQAMIDVQWASIDEAGSLVMPRFDEHNGASAKRRANDNERKRTARKSGSVRKMSASDADEMRTREEKRRSKPSLCAGSCRPSHAQRNDPRLAPGRQAAENLLGSLRRSAGPVHRRCAPGIHCPLRAARPSEYPGRMGADAGEVGAERSESSSIVERQAVHAAPEQ